MPEFSMPFAGKKSDRKLTKEELIRAIRFMIASEYEAVQIYMQAAESTDNEKAAGIGAEHMYDVISDKILKAGNIISLCLLPVIFLVGLLKNKKASEEETKGNFDKTTDFIKNNAGKLVFLGFIPTFIKILRDG